MLGSIDGESFLGHSTGGLVRHFDHRGGDGTLFVAILVIVLIALLDNRFQIFVNRINRTGGMHPAAAFVETLIDKKLSPRGSAVGIQTVVTGDLQFGSEKERRVRVD